MGCFGIALSRKGRGTKTKTAQNSSRGDHFLSLLASTPVIEP